MVYGRDTQISYPSLQGLRDPMQNCLLFMSTMEIRYIRSQVKYEIPVLPFLFLLSLFFQKTATSHSTSLNRIRRSFNYLYFSIHSSIRNHESVIMNLQSLRAFRDQSWPPKATFTDTELGDLTGKVSPPILPSYSLPPFHHPFKSPESSSPPSSLL